MKTITFGNRKGGTGKTTLCASVAVQLALKGKKVLAVDVDPQGNLTTWMYKNDITKDLADVLKNDIIKELADVLMNRCTIKEAICKTEVENLDIIPTASLGGSLNIYQKFHAAQYPFRFRKIISEIKNDYDYVIIDTSPNFGALEESCFLTSDEAIAVLNIDEFSKEGLTSFIENLNDMKERLETEKPKTDKIILNGRNRTLQVQDRILKEIQEATPCRLFIVPVDQGFPKSQIMHTAIQFMDKPKKETLSVINEITESIMGEN